VAITNHQRLTLIEAYLREHQYADLHTLAARFGGSISTIRRALSDLESAGIIRRHHGGASLVEPDGTAGYDFITQDNTNADAKHRIAEAIAAEIADGMTVMLDGGTTTYAVAKNLVRKRIVVVTNSLPIAALLNEVSTCETIVTGGTIYNRLGVVYGPVCESTIAQLHADLAILGCAGVTPEGVWNSNAMLAGYQQKMIAAATMTCFLADGTKIGKRALALTSPFQPNIRLMTTASPPQAIVSAMAAANASLSVV
jgi:DeoR/GlpR family transcriptional regulator of sugar metabolism